MMLWQGPYSHGPMGGVTASMLAKFTVCTERFRLSVVEGLRQDDESLDFTIEYGNLWHIAEEIHRAGGNYKKALFDYGNDLKASYPTEVEEIDKWLSLCWRQFKLAIEIRPKMAGDKQVFEEEAFRVPYTLPSGRVVVLRGKIDDVILRKNCIYNGENKTKGYIDAPAIGATLKGNLQTGVYQIALRESLRDGVIYNIDKGQPTHTHQIKLPKTNLSPRVAGVIYRVVRRPLSDKYAPRQKKSETTDKFYDRVIQLMREDPTHHFQDFTVTIQKHEIEHFKATIFHPTLERLCDWWEWIRVNPTDPWAPRTARQIYDANYPSDPLPVSGPGRQAFDLLGGDEPIYNSLHSQTPWGVYNSLFGGFRGDYYTLLTTKKTHGLKTITDLFPELPKPEPKDGIQTDNRKARSKVRPSGAKS